VTVSYVSTRQPGGDYLALAIHDQIKSGQHGGTDNLGRPITFTTYFCLPYQQLAGASAGYHELYEALSCQRLPARDGQPLRITVTPSSLLSPAIDSMATRVAALLLTGRPVCVLGAQETTLSERLRFIDTVMGLLPYGMRARMSWLEDRVTRPTRHLSELTDPIGFAASQVLSVIVAVSAESPGPRPGGGRRTAPQPAARAPIAPGHGTPPYGEQDHGAALLAECAEHVRTASLPMLNTVITSLKNAARARVTAERRARYLDLITEHQLFRHCEALGSIEAKLREALLRLAFQINVLWWLLKSAYPHRLTRADIYHVMIGTAAPPTATLLAAVLLLLGDPADASVARELYTFSSVVTMSLEPKTRRELEKLFLPGSGTPGALWPEGSAPEPND
jgi:hypothetical protein